ncbi:hypothetical protein CW714_04000, partial [Methanophagales archaeon]
AQIEEGAGGMLKNVVTVTGTPPQGADVTGYDTVEIEVLARTIEPSQWAAFYVVTEVKTDGTVIENEQFGWMTGNGNLLNNPPLAPGEAVGEIKYDDKMISSNGTTELGKSSGVITDFMPNFAVIKDIGYKSGDMGSLSSTEQAGMRYSGASPPLSTSNMSEDVNAYSKMTVTAVNATTETEVGITDTEERDLRYGINAEGTGSVSAGIDASAREKVDRGMSYEDKSTACGGNFSLEQNADYTSKPSTSTSTDLKGDSTVVVEGQFRGERGGTSLLHNDKMIGSNGTMEFEQEVDASKTNFEANKKIGYTSGNMGMGSLSHDEQVSMQYSSKTKCRDVNAHSTMVVTDATTEIKAKTTTSRLHYEINTESKGSVSAGVDAFIKEGRGDISYKGKSIASGGNFTLENDVYYKTRSYVSTTTDLKGDKTVVEDGQLGWGSGTGNLKYDDKMIGSDGTTEFNKDFDADTGTAPNLAVEKSIGYKSSDMGSLSQSEHVGMCYSNASVDVHGKMVATVTNATTETEITGKSLHYGIDAEGNGTVSAGADVSVVDEGADITCKDDSNAYGGSFAFQKEIGYKKPP